MDKQFNLNRTMLHILCICDSSSCIGMSHYYISIMLLLCTIVVMPKDLLYSIASINQNQDHWKRKILILRYSDF